MLSHADVWRGVDRLAEVNGLSPSGLARRAGLDPTTFNKSKRTTRDGRPRWPSTESLAKILGATHTSFGAFVGLVHPQDAGTSGIHLPAVDLSKITAKQFDPSGFLETSAKDLELGTLEADRLYAVSVDTGDYEPVLRRGGAVLVDPGIAVRRHDRVLVMRYAAAPVIGVLVKRTAQELTIGGLVDGARAMTCPAAEVAWVARIVWASQ
ncbi:MAG: helix-turn-helix transcriptional regulator [Pseudomonadota bacterium]